MKDLEQSRLEINRIDKEMAALFEERMQLAQGIAEYKMEHGLPVKDPGREARLIEKNCGCIQSPEIESLYVEFLKKVIDLSCTFQSRVMKGMKVAYCGVEGAFGYIAAKRMYPDARLQAFDSFEDAYHAVESGQMDCAVLPMENSYAGEVGTVMDLLFSGSLYVNRVIDLDVEHHLIGLPGTRTEAVKKVVSHPQALSQCDAYIRSRGFEPVTYANTAMAAKYVKELNDPSVAAIASEATAEIFDLEILDRSINASRANTTRFAAFSRIQNRPADPGRRAEERFILAFTVRNEAGALAQTLNIIGAHGFNMRTLRSRPMKGLLWNYFFYIEGEGNISGQNGKDMLRELTALCAQLRLVGTYYPE